MTRLEEDPYFYTLWEDEANNDFYLDVTCGRTAVFDVTIKLTQAEVEKLREDAGFARSLAYRVLDSPDSFADRRVSLPG